MPNANEKCLSQNGYGKETNKQTNSPGEQKSGDISTLFPNFRSQWLKIQSKQEPNHHWL